MGVVDWDEKEQDKKTLKTRYYSLNSDFLKEKIGSFKSSEEIKDKTDFNDFNKNFLRKEFSITTKFMGWMLKYLEKTDDVEKVINGDESDYYNFKRTFLTSETLKFYRNNLQDLIKEVELKNKTDTSLNSHISINLLIPIKDILDWRKEQKERK